MLPGVSEKFFSGSFELFQAGVHRSHPQRAVVSGIILKLQEAFCGALFRVLAAKSVHRADPQRAVFVFIKRGDGIGCERRTVCACNA